MRGQPIVVSANQSPPVVPPVVPGEEREMARLDAVQLLPAKNSCFPHIFPDGILRDATTERTLNCAGEFCPKLLRNCAKL